MNAARTDHFNTSLATMYFRHLFQKDIRHVSALMLAQFHSSSLTNCLVGHNLNLVEGEG